jgi:hypothetical protein
MVWAQNTRAGSTPAGICNRAVDPAVPSCAAQVSRRKIKLLSDGSGFTISFSGDYSPACADFDLAVLRTRAGKKLHSSQFRQINFS